MRHYQNFINILLIFLLGCGENELDVRGYPKVTTLPVINITPSGALFEAKIDYNDLSEIQDHGFVWGETDNLSVEKSFYVSLGKLKESTFEKEINSSFEAGMTYRVRSYVKTNSKTIYGKVVEFISLGSSRPVIYKISPDRGSFGDTITISGKNFRVKDDKILIKFSEIIAPVLSSNDSIVKTIVPGCATDKVKVKVVVLNNNSQEVDFTFILPTIDAIFPEHPSLCDTISIIGQRFTDDPSNLILKINNETVNIINSSSNKIQFLQAGVYQSPINLSLKVNQYAITVSDAFNQLLPEITSTNSPFSVYDTLIIKGKNFPTCYPLSAYFNSGDFLKIVRNTDTEIHVTFPDLTCGSFIINFFSEAGYGFKSPLIETKKSKIFSISPDSATFNESLIIKGQDIVPSQSLSVTLLNGVISLPINSAKRDELVVSIPETFYQPNNQTLDVTLNGVCDSYILGNAFHLKHPLIGNFNPTLVKDFSGIITIKGQNFNPNTILNNVYFGDELIPSTALMTSTSTELKINLSNLFNENISKTESVKIKVESGGQIGISSGLLNFDYHGAWTRQSNFPGAFRRESQSFSIGNLGFVGLGKDAMTGQFLSDFWSFDPNQNKWTQLNDFPGSPRTGATALVINGKAYVGLGSSESMMLNDWWEYNPASGQWTQKTSLPASARIQAFSFTLNNKGYIGGGQSISTSLQDLWEFDPSLNIWTSKPSGPIDITYSYFEFNNKGFCYQVNQTTGEVIEYSYDPIQNKWSSKISILNLSGGGWSFMRYSNYLIGMRGDSIYKINPTQNSMEILPNFHPIRFGASSFVINNIGYTGLGYGDYNYNNSSFDLYNDFWSFEPSLLK